MEVAGDPKVICETNLSWALYILKEQSAHPAIINDCIEVLCNGAKHVKTPGNFAIVWSPPPMKVAIVPSLHPT